MIHQVMAGNVFVLDNAACPHANEVILLHALARLVFHPCTSCLGICHTLCYIPVVVKDSKTFPTPFAGSSYPCRALNAAMDGVVLAIALFSTCCFAMLILVDCAICLLVAGLPQRYFDHFFGVTILNTRVIWCRSCVYGVNVTW